VKTTSLAEAVIITTSFAACSGAATLCPPPLRVIRPFDLESGVRVMCDVGYLCANFSLSRPLCSRLRPGVCDRQTDRRHQTDVRRASALNAPQGGGIIRRTLSTLVAEPVSAGWMTMTALSGCYCLAEYVSCRSALEVFDCI